MNIIAVTHMGPNKIENEDRIVIGKSLIADGTFQTQSFSGVVAVADGVGGNNAGAVASHFVANRLTVLESVSVEAFTKINEELLELASDKAGCEDMATTLSGISICGEDVSLFSIGNTRVYLLQSRKYLKQLTRDDTTLNYLLATGQLSAEDAKTFERKNEITACFGGGAPNLFKIKFSKIDSLSSPFMMTSDGIHDYISIDEMEDIIAEYGISVAACESMITAARTAGSHDDVSIVLGEL